MLHPQAAVRETAHSDKKKGAKNSKQVVFKIPSLGFVIVMDCVVIDAPLIAALLNFSCCVFDN
jgi:hypothetical protein